MAAIRITRQSCIIRPESWNGRSRYPWPPGKRHPRKISGRYRCRERIGKRAVTRWRCAALLQRAKVRKSVGHHSNCKSRSDLKGEELITWPQIRNHQWNQALAWNDITYIMLKPTCSAAT